MTSRSIQADLLADDFTPSTPRLRASLCKECGRVTFPEQACCPYCGASEYDSILLSTRGTLELCTTVQARPPGYAGDRPFAFGVVALPGGIRIISRILRSEGIQNGDRVKLVVDSLQRDERGEQVVSYAFARADE